MVDNKFSIDSFLHTIFSYVSIPQKLFSHKSFKNRNYLLPLSTLNWLQCFKNKYCTSEQVKKV